MKKLMILAVIAIGMVSFSANAQEKRMTEKMEPSAQTIKKGAEFKEIDKSMLPQTIKDAVLNDLDGMMVSEAYLGVNETFKIVVTSQKDETIKKTLYADSEGNWIKPKGVEQE